MNVTPASFAQQYGALRDGCGIVQLPAWSSVKLTGGDRQKFFNNFCTADVKRLAPGDNAETFVTNVKGKILGHVLITCRDTELVLVGPPGQSSPLVAHFDRYVIREDVALMDATSELSYLLVAGEQARDLLAHLDQNRHDASSSEHRPGNYDSVLNGIAVRMIAWNWLAERQRTPFACLVETPHEEAAELTQALIAAGAVRCGEEAFTAMRIEAGLPLFGIDFDDRNLPQEVGRDERAISFTKGCYLGQETVARIDALGHVNQQLVGVRFSGEVLPKAGIELAFSGTSVGPVRSASYSPRLAAPLALAMVRRDWNAPGTRLDSPIGPCEVVGLPVQAGNG